MEKRTFWVMRKKPMKEREREKSQSVDFDDLIQMLQTSL